MAVAESALKLEVKPIAGALGAEIHGVDLSRELDAATVAEIRRIWLRYNVVFFRGQNLTSAQYMDFARRLGKPVEYPFVKGMEGFPELTAVVKLEHEKVNFGGVWHADTTYLPNPPMATMLLAREIPPCGGDTLFANQYLAYETLSATLRGVVDELVAVNTSWPTCRRRARTASPPTGGSKRKRNMFQSIRPSWFTRRPAVGPYMSTSRTRRVFAA